MSTPSAPPEATVLDGRYVLGEPLGRGGMAEVFRARDTVLNREVAVKVFHQHAAMPDGDERRAAEVHLLASLSHSGLVTVFDAGRDTSDPTDPFAYLVMELVEGSTLASAIAEGPIAGPELADIAGQLAAALTYVHERGIVHRDIKPANMLLRPPDRTGRTTAKLTDFGVARLLDSTRLTVAGTTLGTANYLSPEQATGGEITPASDIYSFGLVLIEALTGQVAFPGSGVEAAVVRLHHAPTIPSWVDEGWRALLTDMTAFAPADRPDAAAVSIRLRSLRRDTAPTAVFARPASGAAARHPRRPLWIAAALAVAAVVIAVVLGVTGGDSLPGTPTASYPTVVGSLGTHLRALEAAVPAALSGDVSAVAVAAAKSDFATARSDLQRLSADLVAARRSGDIAPAGYRRMVGAIALVRADLRAALRAIAARSRSASVTLRKSAATSTTPAPTTHPVAPPPVHHVPPGQAKKGPGPKPPKGHGRGHGRGHGSGPGEGGDG